MSGKKWSEIADTKQSNDTDEFLVIQGGVSKRITKLDFLGVNYSSIAFITAKKDINLDVMQDNQKVLFNRIGGLSYLAGTASDTDLNKKTDSMQSDFPIRYAVAQVMPTDKAIALQSRELITVANVVQSLDNLKTILEAPRDNYTLKGHNPYMKMEVIAGGKTAQMSVEDGETKHMVATMEWHKATQSFNFILFDKDSGGTKNSFSLFNDGTANLFGKKVSTGIPTPPTADGEYKLVIASGVATWATI